MIVKNNKKFDFPDKKKNFPLVACLNFNHIKEDFVRFLVPFSKTFYAQNAKYFTLRNVFFAACRRFKTGWEFKVASGFS